MVSNLQNNVHIQSEIAVGNLNDPVINNNMQLVKTEIDHLLNDQVCSAAFRAKVRDVEFGDKPSAYFFGLEKRNYVGKTMYLLCKRDGNLTKDYHEILCEQKNFYMNLYQNNRDVRFNIVNNGQTELTQEQSDSINHDPTEEEIKEALGLLHRERMPGSDGLSGEFFEKFYDDLKTPLLKMY